MKVAFIVQRYGTEVLGGSEYHCRLIAERLAGQHQVEVLTTCARDYITWKNEYAEGADRIRGVTVRRFANAGARDIEAFNRYSEWIFNNAHTRADEMEWLKQQGPWCPALIEYLRHNHLQYDVLVFFTYLYAPTVLGLEINPVRSILVPTSHDEPAIRLEIYKDVFSKPAALLFNTDSERTFVQDLFRDLPKTEDVVGVGVDLPQSQPYPRTPGRPDEDADQNAPPGPSTAEDDDGEARAYPSHLLTRGAIFRRRHRLYGPILLYGGRIDPGKGCEELIHYFSEYVKEGGDATLVLMGVKLMSLPEEPFIRFAGLLSDRERLQALEAATVVCCPSPFESLSLLALEAMSAGTPILGNARSAVLVEHCVRGNGGLYYADRDEFVECLKLLIRDDTLRAALGRNGRDYVRKNYRWDIVLGKYERLFAKIRGAKT
ncbi:MAG: glycosyltransferase family 4 protein [Acidobacteria bacterium]|nr:glycosyltransferase family 4 protein [Acidobacteriota bacterium]